MHESRANTRVTVYMTSWFTVLFGPRFPPIAENGISPRNRRNSHIFYTVRNFNFEFSGFSFFSTEKPPLRTGFRYIFTEKSCLLVEKLKTWAWFVHSLRLYNTRCTIINDGSTQHLITKITYNNRMQPETAILMKQKAIGLHNTEIYV